MGKSVEVVSLTSTLLAFRLQHVERRGANGDVGDSDRRKRGPLQHYGIGERFGFSTDVAGTVLMRRA